MRVLERREKNDYLKNDYLKNDYLKNIKNKTMMKYTL
jgi:hypothetical protein